jgi:hypothetical protein
MNAPLVCFSVPKSWRHGKCISEDMKTRLFAFALCLTGSLNLGLFRASAEFEVSAGISIQSPADFYQPLAARGSWIQVGAYGRCWHPAVTAEWRPYCNGYWAWTDCGWYWVSDEPWAWACYHYGTWAFDPTDGWVWVPGVEWAPAWVNWRTGGDYIGWAPCGPGGVTVDASAYVFVEGRHFNDHLRPDNVIVNNTSIISRTTEIRNVTREERQVGGRTQNVFVNNGPGVAMVEKATGHKFTPVSVQKVDQTTNRSVPEQLRRQTTEPRTIEQQPTEPERGMTQPDLRDSQRPVEQPKASPGGNQLMPRDFPPRPDVPAEKNLPPERTVPQIPPERTIPQAPFHDEIPGNKLQSPKGVVPPTQTPRQPAPGAPLGNPVPAEKGRDKDQDHT